MKHTILLLLALALAGGCATRPRQDAAGPRPDSWLVVDAAIAAWLRDSPNLTRSQPNLKRDELLVLREAGLPKGYQSAVPTQMIVVLDIPEGQGPPVGAPGKVIPAHRSLPVPEHRPPSGVKEVWRYSAHIIQVDSIKINGDSAEVEISDDRHNNLGGSGTTYKLQRMNSGWMVLPISKMWMS